jgi:hypothetical protein
MDVPWPTIWSRFRNRGLPILLACSTSVVLIVLAALWLTSGNPYALPLLLFGGAICILVTANYITTGTSARRGVDAVVRVRLRTGGQSAVLLPTLRAATMLMAIGLFLMSVPMVFFPWVMDRIPVSGSWRDSQLRAWEPLMVVGGLALLGWLMCRLFRKRPELGIGLSPEGVYHWSWMGACFYPWDHIVSVRPRAYRAPLVELGVREPNDRSANAEENWVSKFHAYRRKLTQLLVNALAVNPGAAYIALVFYHRHPELRHELAGDEAVTRIQKLDFPELITELEKTGDLSPTTR